MIAVAETRVCTQCGSELPATREHFFGARPGNLRGDCKACTRARNNLNASRNRAEKREYDRRYREANRERLAAQKAAAYESNPEPAKTRSMQWRANNRERHRASVHRRRALAMGCEGAYTAADVRAQYARQSGRCYYCSVVVGDTYHVDHAVPLARGGSNGPDNIVVSCPTCNLRKHTRLPHEFGWRLC